MDGMWTTDWNTDTYMKTLTHTDYLLSFEDGFRFGIGWEKRRRSLRETAMGYKRKGNMRKYTLALRKLEHHKKYITINDIFIKKYEKNK